MNMVFMSFHKMCVSATSGTEVISNKPTYTYLHLKYALGVQCSVLSWDFNGGESGSVITLHTESGHNTIYYNLIFLNLTKIYVS
jgi:hypothetical protein